MRIPNREINIFNLSMLDIICGALGAFLIVTIILIPSYQNQAKVKVAEVTEKQKENVRTKEEIEKLKARAKDDERLEKMWQENEQLAERLAELEQELKRKQQQVGGAGVNPPMYFHVYWTWKLGMISGLRFDEYPLIDLKVSVIPTPPGSPEEIVVLGGPPEFYVRPGGLPRDSGFGVKYVVIEDPNSDEYELHYEVSPMAPKTLFVGGYVQYGERVVSLNDAVVEAPTEGLDWKHFHGTARRVSLEGKKGRTLFFELSREGNVHVACASRRYDEILRFRAESAIEKQRGPGRRSTGRQTRRSRCWFGPRFRKAQKSQP